MITEDDEKCCAVQNAIGAAIKDGTELHIVMAALAALLIDACMDTDMRKEKMLESLDWQWDQQYEIRKGRMQ